MHESRSVNTIPCAYTGAFHEPWQFIHAGPTSLQSKDSILSPASFSQSKNGKKLMLRIIYTLVSWGIVC